MFAGAVRQCPPGESQIATVDQSLVQSGFDVEALLTARYLQMLLQTAYDAGVIPSFAVLSGTRIDLAMLNSGRLYEPTPAPDGSLPPTSGNAFETEILFNHPLGANIRVRAVVQPESGLPVPFDLFVQTGLAKEREEGTLSKLVLAVHVVDVDSPALTILAAPPYNLSKAQVLAGIQTFVDRTIDLGGASKFKKVEDFFIKWHEGDGEHPPALGVYINVRLRNGDEEDQFLPPRGDLDAALNFLPDSEDMAMASRPGVYADMSKDVYSRTAVRNEVGVMEHALRYNILNPKSKRIGDVDSIKVGRIPPIVTGDGQPVPQNGMRITLEGEYVDLKEFTNTDVTFTIDIRPSIDDDGLLEWDTNFDVDIDALFEFMTFWAATLVGICFGPIGLGIFLGIVLVGEIGAGIFFGDYFEARVSKKADATLSDVIPDRLTIKTRRWDPFYATLHQVVTKPSQAEFNDKGFLMCGRAFVGRELVPPVDTVIRDETRDGNAELTGLRYRMADYEQIREDIALNAAGTSRRDFTSPDPAEPDLFTLTLDQFQARVDDPEGPLVLTKIPYFPAMVYIVEHQIDQLLCISASELEDVRDGLRGEAADRTYARIVAQEGDAIRQEVTADLPAATQEETDAEVERRIQEKVKAAMDKYESPTPLQLAFLGRLKPFLRFDLSPEELVMLQKKNVIVMDNALNIVEPRQLRPYLRDEQDPPGDDAGYDNLLNRPRYRPTPAGPVFP
jgi:hypothetical protein